MSKKRKDVEEDEVVDESTSGGSIAVNDAWTGMLAISLLALMAGTGFLVYDYMQYTEKDLPPVPKFTTKGPSTDKAPEKTAEEKKTQ